MRRTFKCAHKKLGLVVQLVLVIDAKATEHILHIQKVNRMKHIGTLVVRHVNSVQHMVDLGTQALSGAALSRNAGNLGYSKSSSHRENEYARTEGQSGVSSQSVVAVGGSSRKRVAMSKSSRERRRIVEGRVMKDGEHDQPHELDEGHWPGDCVEVTLGEVWHFNNVLGSGLHNTVYFSFF